MCDFLEVPKRMYDSEFEIKIFCIFYIDILYVIIPFKTFVLLMINFEIIFMVVND